MNFDWKSFIGSKSIFEDTNHQNAFLFEYDLTTVPGLKELNKKSQPKVFIFPKPILPKTQPDYITKLDLKGGGVKVSTTISELCKQVVVDRPATLKVD